MSTSIRTGSSAACADALLGRHHTLSSFGSCANAHTSIVVDGDDGVPNGEIPGLIRAGSSQRLVIVADRVTMTHPDHALLVIDLFEEPPCA